MGDNKWVLFESTNLIVICYSTTKTKKQIHCSSTHCSSMHNLTLLFKSQGLVKTWNINAKCQYLSPWPHHPDSAPPASKPPSKCSLLTCFFLASLPYDDVTALIPVLCSIVLLHYLPQQNHILEPTQPTAFPSLWMRKPYPFVAYMPLCL